MTDTRSKPDGSLSGTRRLQEEAAASMHRNKVELDEIKPQRMEGHWQNFERMVENPRMPTPNRPSKPHVPSEE